MRSFPEFTFVPALQKTVVFIVELALVITGATHLADANVGSLARDIFLQAVTAGESPEQLFRSGETALQQGNLDLAEHSFRGVLALDPKAAGAYANLGVIYMRRRQWKMALEMLHKAEALAPKLAGIRLNIGLAYYRQNDFRASIPAFKSVLRDMPESAQPRHLLGLCYFFTAQYADAVKTLEPMWAEQSNDLSYLYVLGIAANKAGNPQLEDRALGRLVEIGQNSAEFHLFMGKAHLNREEFDGAIRELLLATQLDPKLPFAHFNLGLAYMKQQKLSEAKAEFLKDIAIEPDVAENYDQLGLIYFQQQQDNEAEKNLRHALQLNSNLTSSHYQLARVLQREGKYPQALAQVDAALGLEPNGQTLHYIRGQILLRMGRSQEAQVEMAESVEIMNAARVKRQKELENGPLPSPELAVEPQ